MHFVAIALSFFALISALLALPRSEIEVLEQLRGIPDGWTQVWWLYRSKVLNIDSSNLRVQLPQRQPYLYSELRFINRDKSSLSKWSSTCQLPIIQVMVNT